MSIWQCPKLSEQSMRRLQKLADQGFTVSIDGRQLEPCPSAEADQAGPRL